MGLIPDLSFLKGPAKGSFIAVLFLLILTYLFLRSDNRKFSELGLEWRPERGKQLAIGILAGVLMSSVSAVLLSYMFKFTWHLNPNFDLGIILLGLLLNCWSVLAEELLYRGYAFKRALDILGSWRAILIFIFVFAISHWFAWGVWGNLLKMLSVLCTVGLGGLLFSLAFLRTGSLALSIGLHLGFIWSNADLFTNMFARWYNNQNGLFYPSGTDFYNRHANNWLTINIPYFIVLILSIFLIFKLTKTTAQRTTAVL